MPVTTQKITASVAELTRTLDTVVEWGTILSSSSKFGAPDTREFTLWADDLTFPHHSKTRSEFYGYIKGIEDGCVLKQSISQDDYKYNDEDCQKAADIAEAALAEVDDEVPRFCFTFMLGWKAALAHIKNTTP